jgi:hypothetical protein
MIRKKPAPHLLRGGYRFSEKIMRKKAIASRAEQGVAPRSRGLCCPSFVLQDTLFSERAQGRPGAGRTHGPRANKMHGQEPQVRAEQPGLPCAVVLTAAPRSPRCAGFLATVARATHQRRRKFSISVGMPGPHGLAVRRIVSRLAQKRLTLRRPPHPALNVRDDRETPLLIERGTARNILVICPTGQG